MTRQCVGCGEDLPTSARSNRLRCKPDCGRTTNHKARTQTRERHDIQFIGVDGEGVTSCVDCGAIKGEDPVCDCGRSDWVHEYVLLTVGSNDPIYNKDGSHLHWEDIFNYLYDCYKKNPGAAYVGFFLGYDFTQWLRTIPQNRAESLLTPKGIAQRARKNSGGNKKPFPVHLGEWEWEIDTLGMKRFSLRPGTGYPPGEVKNTNKAMIICDTGSFFQKRFVDVIASHVGTLITQDEFNLVVEGKTRRSVARLDDDMKRYNALENDILSRVMRQLNEGFTSVGIRLNRNQWFGPGQAAQKWLNNIGAPTSEIVYKTIPKWAAEAARKTYYGGWFEIMCHGIIPGETYEYDINSAYPYAIANLPCLLHGVWSHSQHVPILPDMPKESLRMLYATVRGSNGEIGSLPHRTSKGRILRPQQTRGWYWEHEIVAATAAGLIDEIEVHEYVQYDPCDCPKPFRSIAELYQQRLLVGKNTPSGVAYKLVYNSSYGKMAQSVGHPKFSNGVYASLITSACRTRILEAIATHPLGTRSVLMVATDGVYFSSPHPSLEMDPEKLGAWDASVKHNMCLFMPGVYWDDSSRKALKDGKEVRVKSRGISARDLSLVIESIDRQFSEMKDGREWPSITIPIQFSMVSGKLALARGKWNTAGKVEFDGVKTISSNPVSKRRSNLVYRNGLLATTPYSQSDQLETTPYDKRFAEAIEEWELTPEGPINLDLNGMLHGN